MLIDLGNYLETLQRFIEQSTSSYLDEHPDESVSTVGIFGCGFHGTVSLHFDTPQHSAAHVERWHKKGPGWYGEDSFGKFCDNCEDFAFLTGELLLPDYPDLYQSANDEPIDFIALDGSRVRAEPYDGDEGKQRAVFPFLKAMLSRAEFAQLDRARPFRVGVQMHDSTFEEFWVVEEC